MEKIQQSNVCETETVEPTNVENSVNSDITNEIQNSEIEEGQSQKDPSENLILGKFKSVEDLSKAYLELQKHQGQSSKELGELRKTANSVGDLSETLKQAIELSSQYSDYLKEYKEKYNSPEYFQDSSFREFYKEAFKVLGKNLDTDRFVSLLENYVGSRISAYEKKKSASSETEEILSSMTYDKNPKSALTPPKKRFDEMTEKEIDEMLDKVI